MTSFSQEDKKELLDRLVVLRQVCCPATDLLVPEFKFKRKKDFEPTDVLPYGVSYDLAPDQLKDIWEDRETLRDHNVDYIMVNGKKWFYNTAQIVTDFYPQNGTKKVEVRFPIWMDCENIWNQPENVEAMKKVLEKCSGRHFPTQQEALECFPKKLLRRIYDKNPSRPAIENAVLEMVETLRTKCQDYLMDNHLNNIFKDKDFLTFVRKTSFPVNTSDKQKAKEYLERNKQAMYFLAQKFGLIKNAIPMMYYEEMRNHIRHPNTVLPLHIDPRMTYQDFAKALDVPAKGPSRAKTLKTFNENTDIVQHLGDMSYIWEVLDQYVDPKLRRKKKKPAYYQDLIQKGIITPDEAKIINQKRVECNNAAHLNGPRNQARKKVMEDTSLICILHELYRRDHERQTQRRLWFDCPSRMI